MTELTGKDIVQILRACSETGVTTLKLGELEVAFGSWKQTFELKDLPETSVKEDGYSPVIQDDVLSKEDQRVLEEYERELQEAALLVEDPVAWQEAELTRRSED